MKAETSTHLESASLYLAPWSSRKACCISHGHGLQVLVVAVCTLCIRVLKAETSPHLESACTPRIVEQPQACSISRSFMAASLSWPARLVGAWNQHTGMRSCCMKSEVGMCEKCGDCIEGAWTASKILLWKTSALVRGFL